MKLALPILAAAALAAVEARAATPPSFLINDGSVREGFSISPQITKSAKASSYSKISCTVTDGTAKAGIDYVKPAATTITIGNNALVANCPAIATINNQILDGTRTLVVTIKAVRNATIARAQATIQIFDDEVPPPAPPPSVITCPDGSTVPVGTNCPLPPNAVTCPNGDIVVPPFPCPVVPPAPTPVPTPTPTPTPLPATAWVNAPLIVGGYAFVPDVVGSPAVTTQCCKGLIVRVTARTMSTDAVPVPIWWVSYYTDTRGEAANPDQLRTIIGEQSNLQGAAPAQ